MFDAKQFIAKALTDIRKIIGKHRVISACSGGVDSTTTTFLLHQAVGNQLLAVFIEDGLRREGEPEFVMTTLKNLGIQVRLINAYEDFFATLEGKTDAEIYGIVSLLLE